MIDLIAVGSKTNGAKKGDDIGGDGIVLRVTKSNSAEGGGKVKNGEVEWSKGSREGG